MGNCKGDFPTYICTSVYNTIEDLQNLVKLHKLPVFFYDCEEAYFDEVGGYHDCAEGWNPHGVWCGECTNKSCANCPSKNMKERKQ